MKLVKVQYTVAPDFVEANEINIEALAAALAEKPIEGFKTAAFVLDDGQTFFHINLARDQETFSSFTEMPAFKTFFAALKASEPIVPPAPENLTLVAASFEF